MCVCVYPVFFYYIQRALLLHGHRPLVGDDKSKRRGHL